MSIGSDFAGLAGTAITTIGTVAITGEVAKSLRAFGKKEAMITGTLHFKSKEGYRKYLAYIHIRGLNEIPGNQKIFIGGKPHKVRHMRGK